ncbi:MAG: hypothetical protein HC897_19815 [Thermoanaerobaculia bacterium]|nr:hypothetical protein [Thermoanaerobaculia bacterium]
MKTSKLFFPICGLTIVTALSLGRFGQVGPETLAATTSGDLQNHPLRHQAHTPRNWIADSARRQWTIESSEEMPLFGPFSLAIDAEGNHLILDSGDLTLKKFDRHGHPLKAFGNGKGQGPGELVSLTGFAPAPAAKSGPLT